MPAPAIQTVGSVVNNTDNAATTIVVPKPTSLAEGDLMVAALVFRGKNSLGTQNLSGPSGWTRRVLDTENGASGIDVQLDIWTKVADAGDVAASSFTWTGEGGGTEQTRVHVGKIIRISGQRVTNPVSAAAIANCAGSAGTSCIAPSVTAAADEALLLNFYAANRGAGGISFTVPGSQTELYDTEASHASALDRAQACGHEDVNTGAAGTRTATINASLTWVAASVIVESQDAPVGSDEASQHRGLGRGLHRGMA